MKNLNYIIIVIALFSSLKVWAQTGNTTYGNAAGVNITTGDNLTIMGDSAAYHYSTGSNSTLIGKSAGFNLDNDSDNTIIGAFANYLGTSGADNVIIGARAGHQNNGYDNTFIGNEAGYQNTTGGDNTFIGEEAGRNNTIGEDNTFVGEDAGRNNTTGNDNTFLGANAGRQNQTGYRNTAVGNEAGWDITTGYRNTMVGDSAGTDIGVGYHNTMIGQGAGAATEHASWNTFVGGYAGRDNNRINSTTGGLRNSYLGFNAGSFCREGNDNTGMGYKANFSHAINFNREFFRNTFMGTNANMRKDDGVAMGYATSVRKDFGIAIGSNAISDGINSIAIGYQAATVADNEVVIGNSTITSIGGSVNWTATSDGRYKTAVREDVKGLDFIDRLRPVTYHYDVEKLHINSGFSTDSLSSFISQKEQIRYSGFIAQEVEQAANEVGYDFSGVDTPQNEDDLYGLRYAEFTVPMVKAMQELHKKVKIQELLIQQQQIELQAYQQLFSQLESRLILLEYSNTPQVGSQFLTTITAKQNQD